MDHVNCFIEDMFESIPDYRKTVLLKFLLKNDKDLLKECGFPKNDNNRLKKNIKNF